ncbi:hypothetical protein [Roseateles sp. BYS87W]|uniref:Secreted protein n=1 Tax=Pelomonas baiyunensis TaxID=3299026 RepID=A0ABW7H1R7_9BURK
MSRSLHASFPRAWLALLAATLAAGQAHASCRTHDRSEQVALVLCSTHTDAAALKAAGEAACKGKTLCNAWIWDDASKMPAQAPVADKDLPKSASSAARAIWIHDSQHLMQLRKAR